MKLALLACIIILFPSCKINYVPLKGSYPENPIVSYSDKSRDRVWDNIIDLFAQKGISIKIIDKSSGLIISEPIKLKWSYEDKSGHVIKPDALVAVWATKHNGDYLDPHSVSGEWNIRIKEANGKTAINVNIVNVKHEELDPGSTMRRAFYTLEDYPTGAVKSTGVFEKSITDYIK